MGGTRAAKSRLAQDATPLEPRAVALRDGPGVRRPDLLVFAEAGASVTRPFCEAHPSEHARRRLLGEAREAAALDVERSAGFVGGFDAHNCGVPGGVAFQHLAGARGEVLLLSVPDEKAHDHPLDAFDLHRAGEEGFGRARDAVAVAGASSTQVVPRAPRAVAHLEAIDGDLLRTQAQGALHMTGLV